MRIYLKDAILSCPLRCEVPLHPLLTSLSSVFSSSSIAQTPFGLSLASQCRRPRRCGGLSHATPLLRWGSGPPAPSPVGSRRAARTPGQAAHRLGGCASFVGRALPRGHAPFWARAAREALPPWLAARCRGGRVHYAG